MVYISNKQKIEDILIRVIIPALKNKDLDYEKTIQAIMTETLSSRGIVEEALRKHIPNEIQESHTLHFPNEKVASLLDELRKQETELKKELEVLDENKVNLSK